MPNSLPGYAGQILRVNLTSGTVTTTPTSNYVPTYIGGRGIATRIYWEDVPPNVGAFDPANEVIFMTGPVQGTPYTGGGRWVVVGKAPLAFPLEHISASKAGGYAAAELKFAGFDGIVVSGASATPVYLWIHDGSCEILDASGLWGLDTRQTFSMLQQIHGTNAKAISIGQAGEHWSRMASIVSDTKPAFGKGGFGGVMGSKNLKAICISGTGSVEIANPTNFFALRQLADQWAGYLRTPITGYNSTVYPAKKVSNTGSLSASISASYSPVSAPSGSVIGDMALSGNVTIHDGSCYGCNKNCRQTLSTLDGSLPGGATMCQESYFYDTYEYSYYGGKGRGPVAWMAHTLANMLTLDAVDINHPSGYAHKFEWMWTAMKSGVLTNANTGWTITPSAAATITDYEGQTFIQGVNAPLLGANWGSQVMTNTWMNDTANRANFGALRCEGSMKAAYMVAANVGATGVPLTGTSQFGTAGAATTPTGLTSCSVLPNMHVQIDQGGKFAGYNEHWCYGNGDSYVQFPVIANAAMDCREPHDCHTYGQVYSAPASGSNTDPSAWATMVRGLLSKYAGTDSNVMVLPPCITEGHNVAKWLQILKWSVDSLLMCDESTNSYQTYSSYDPSGYSVTPVTPNSFGTLASDLYNAITGNSITEAQMQQTYMLRLMNLERAIACREGRWAVDDDMSDEFLMWPCNSHTYYYTTPLGAATTGAVAAATGVSTTTGLNTAGTVSAVPVNNIQNPPGSPNYYSPSSWATGVTWGTTPTGTYTAVNGIGGSYARAVLKQLFANLYTLMGWDAQGVPTVSTLTSLGLTDVATDLTSRGIYSNEPEQ